MLRRLIAAGIGGAVILLGIPFTIVGVLWRIAVSGFQTGCGLAGILSDWISKVAHDGR